MSPADLDAMMEGVTALLENVTPGPWRLGSWGDNVFGTGPNDEWLLICRIKRDDAPVNESRDGADARFIAASRELVPALAAEVRAQREAKDGAYLERNKLVALLASLYPSGIKRTAIEGWSADWHGCVYIDFPWGQASWHYHDSHAGLFEHLPPYAGEWDGHTTEAKYDAIVQASRAQRETIAGLEARVEALTGELKPFAFLQYPDEFCGDETDVQSALLDHSDVQRARLALSGDTPND